MTLQIHTAPSDSTAMHLVLDGKLDAITSTELDQFLNDRLDQAINTLIIDLQNLSFVSSAGLRIFAKARKILKSRDGKVCFVNPSPQVRRVFEIVKAVPVSEVFQDIQELDAYLATIQRKVAEEEGT